MDTTSKETLKSAARGTAWTGTLFLAIALAGAASMTGCRGERSAKRPRQFIPDMDDSPKWKPQTQSAFFEDGRTMRPPVAGAVAFGSSDRVDDATRADFLKDNDAYYFGSTGVDAKGEPVFADVIPVESIEGWPAEAKEGEAAADLLTRREAFMGEVIQRGQERFNIYCSVCHGFEGDGKGMVGQRWQGVVANFHDPKYVDKSVPQGKDGYLFNVVRHGVPFPNTKNEALRMPAYGHAVNEQDAWAIVAYLRVLQAARTNIESVPPAQREALRLVPKPAPKGEPPAATPPATPAATPATPPSNPTQGGGQ